MRLWIGTSTFKCSKFLATLYKQILFPIINIFSNSVIAKINYHFPTCDLIIQFVSFSIFSQVLVQHEHSLWNSGSITIATNIYPSMHCRSCVDCLSSWLTLVVLLCTSYMAECLPTESPIIFSYDDSKCPYISQEFYNK